MIRKLTHIDAPAEVVRSVVRDTDAWPRWMPDMASTRTLDSGAGRRQIEATFLVMGRRRVQHLDCREQDGSLIHRQVIGWFHEWQATWAFLPPPEGRGSVVSLSVELDAGIAGLLLSRKVLSGWIRGWVDDTVDRLRGRAQRSVRRRREPTPAVELGQPVLQVYETADGFEVCFAGRTFTIDAREVSET